MHPQRFNSASDLRFDCAQRGLPASCFTDDPLVFTRGRTFNWRGVGNLLAACALIALGYWVAS